MCHSLISNLYVQYVDVKLIMVQMFSSILKDSILIYVQKEPIQFILYNEMFPNYTFFNWAYSGKSIQLF